MKGATRRACVSARSLHACARAGECQTELDQWCATVKPGEARLAKCMSDQLAAEAKADYKGSKTSAACSKEVAGFKIARSRNINADLPLAKACKADADKLCATKYDVRTASVLDSSALPQNHMILHLECMDAWMQ